MGGPWAQSLSTKHIGGGGVDIQPAYQPGALFKGVGRMLPNDHPGLQEASRASATENRSSDTLTLEAKQLLGRDGFLSRILGSRSASQTHLCFHLGTPSFPPGILDFASLNLQGLLHLCSKQEQSVGVPPPQGCGGSLSFSRRRPAS